MDLAYIPLAILPRRQLQDPHVRDGQPTAGTPGRDPNQSQVRHEGAQHTYRNSQAPGSCSRLLRLLMILDTFCFSVCHIVWRLYDFELCWCLRYFVCFLIPPRLYLLFEICFSAAFV